MWWMTTKWRLSGRGWAIAFGIACLSAAVLGLGALFPPFQPVAVAIVGLGMAIGLVFAVVARSREFDQYDLRRPEERHAGNDEERGD